MLLQLVGLKKEVKLNDGLYSVNTSQLLKDMKATDLIIIPALLGEMKSVIAQNQKIVALDK